jgi:serine/threonine protein kinase
MGLIMSPAAEMDLSTYLLCADTTKHIELRTFFDCLARALEFLHEQRVRHKDIKPSNILVHGGNVLFTDFGLAFDFTDAEGSTTVSTVNGMTPRYCAPEVANHDSRNISFDIWSLGVVFLEMIVVLKGRGVEYIYDFLSKHGSRQAFVRTNPMGVNELIVELKKTTHPADNAALGWAQDMLRIQHDQRPTAVSLMESITAVGEGGNRRFCGICCVSPDDLLDGFSDLEIVEE